MRQSNSWIVPAALAAGATYAVWSMWRNRSRYDFGGKSVLITGGSRGLGLLLARQLIARGARVAICARDAAELQRAEDDLRARGGQAVGIACDLTQREDVERMVHQVRNTLGPVDVLINNAGVIQTGPLDVMTVEDYEAAMRIHFWACLYTVLAVLPEMRRRGGRIVNIASIGGEISVPHLLPYCASKFALVGLSQGLRAELAADGITVTTISPGLMRTGSPRNALFKGQHEAEYAWFILGDSLPGASMDADRAAYQILEACARGDAKVVLSVPAKVARLVAAVAPGLVSDALGLVNRLLPGPGGIGTRSEKGYNSRPSWLPSWTTALTDKAARRNNEMGEPLLDKGAGL